MESVKGEIMAVYLLNIKGSKKTLEQWTEQPSRFRGKKALIAVLVFALLLAYVAYTSPESLSSILGIVWSKPSEMTAATVGLSAITFPSSIKPGENATITLSFENSDEVKHNVSVYITPSIPGRLMLYLGNELLSNNYTSWFYSKILDPGERSTVPIKVEGVLEPGEKSITFDVTIAYSIDGVFEEGSTKSYTVRISS